MSTKHTRQLLVKTKTTLRFGVVQKHTLSKFLTLIVADFHGFRKLFDQVKNNVRKIDRNSVGNWWATGCLLSKNPVGNWILTGFPLSKNLSGPRLLTGCLLSKDPSGRRLPTESGRMTFLQNYQTKWEEKSLFPTENLNNYSTNQEGKCHEFQHPGFIIK